MHNLLIVLICLLVIEHSYGQKLNDFNEPTSNHVLINGTNISMIPPPNFNQTANFKGFLNSEDRATMIMVMEIPGPYKEIVKGFTDDMLVTRGMKLSEKVDLQISDYSALLITLEQDANGLLYEKSILVYGDSTATTMVNGVYLKDSIETGKAIQKSIKSVVIDTVLVVNPREALPYEVNEQVGNLKFANVMGNSMLFSRDGKIPTESEEMVLLFVDKSFAKVTIPDKKAFCISRLDNYPDDFQLIEKQGVNEVVINDFKGYELYAKKSGETKEKEEVFYQVVLFDGEYGYYILAGSCLASSELALDDIKQVINTFSLK
ncbi:MAG: hypothetical protein AAGI07_12555 [Bacteroidota bacterium]